MALTFSSGEQVALPEMTLSKRVLLPAQKSALIVVDMQNDFVKPGGRLVVPSAEATLPALGATIERARAAGLRIVYTQDTHLEGDKEWAIWPEHCRKGSWGWEIVDELAPRGDDLVVHKSRYDGFYDTSLDHYLSRVWGIEHLLILGTISSICVLHTAASAGLRWFHVVTAVDGISALNDFDMALTVRQISWLYTGEVVRSVEDVVFNA